MEQEPEQVEQHDHEALLTGVVALASLFSNCVEAFGLIHPAHKERREQLLIARLGIQQARLLIWGDVVGIPSPPRTVTDRAIPRYPSAAYPDLSEPTFFGPRDPRLDEEDTRKPIEDALNAIAERSPHFTREQMMEQYGLRAPKKYMSGHEPALDGTRLEAFREKYELLQEVAESYAHLNTRRSKSIINQSWIIDDPQKFANFIALIKEKVDSLIQLMGNKERVDRAMQVDIRSFGWHMIDDKTRTMQDKLKLGLISDACKGEYPEYQSASQQALDQISREFRERGMPDTFEWMHNAGGKGVEQPKSKRPGLFGIFKSFNKHKESGKGQSLSTVPLRNSPKSADGPPRSMSDAKFNTNDPDTAEESLVPLRSKSLGYVLQPDHQPIYADATDIKTAQSNAEETSEIEPQPLNRTNTVESHISRHDQYQGLARTATKDLR